MKTSAAKTWAIIPARAGSKGIPDKCLCKLSGTPLISIAIKNALQATSVDRVFVSTDSRKIADQALESGAEVPFLRPEELAQDDSSIVDGVTHMLKILTKSNENSPEKIVLLQLTSPFTRPADIDNAWKLFSKKTDAVVSMCPSEVKPDWMRILDKDGIMQRATGLQCPTHTPRQLMPDYYRLNGALYWIKTKVFLKEQTFLPENRTRGYIMSNERSVDIDLPHDLKYAQWLMETGFSDNEEV